jgi:hypothetical protein
MAKKLYESILPFIREESGKVTTIAVVKLITRKPVKTAEEQTQALIEAVSLWTQNSNGGRTCWNDSSSDLNIGDLANYDATFQAWLHKKEWSGLVLADIEFLWVGECGDSMYYDRHLCDTK